MLILFTGGQSLGGTLVPSSLLVSLTPELGLEGFLLRRLDAESDAGLRAHFRETLASVLSQVSLTLMNADCTVHILVYNFV